MSTSLNASIEPQFRTFAGLRIHYAESSGSREPALPLTRPWPESLRSRTGLVHETPPSALGSRV
jgi:hypothetical protein